METAVQYLLAAGVGGVLLAQLLALIRSVGGALIRSSRERKGLLRLLYVEVAQNKVNIAYIANELGRPHRAKTALVMRGRYVDADAWKAARVKLSQHISSKHFAALSDYYKNILLLEDVVTEERGKKDKATDRHTAYETSSEIIEQVKLLLQALQEQESVVQELIEAQVPDVSQSDRYAELAQERLLQNTTNLENRREIRGD